MDTARLKLDGSADYEWIIELLECYEKEYQEDIRSGKAAAMVADGLSILPNFNQWKQSSSIVPSFIASTEYPPVDSRSGTYLSPKALGGKFYFLFN